MKITQILIVTLLTLTGLAARADSTSTGSPTRVACVGDSITAGAGSTHHYPNQLQEMLGNQWLVKNFGLSGRTLLKKGNSPYWREKAFQAAQDFKPNVVIIMLGTNDTKPKNWVHHGEFAADYKEMVEIFKNLDSKPKIFLCLPTPVFGAGNYGINEANLDVEIPLIKQLATDEQAGIIDMHAALDGKAQLEPDNVHPNADGDTLMAKAAADALMGKTPATP